mmetsp:Transcript_17388/g.25541  ORF Transcript_17388/g.25541 Transcript_17388/m.25541 type:complete len:85 (+) Transcript_17388:520-774(+)
MGPSPGPALSPTVAVSTNDSMGAATHTAKHGTANFRISFKLGRGGGDFSTSLPPPPRDSKQRTDPLRALLLLHLCDTDSMALCW